MKQLLEKQNAELDPMLMEEEDHSDENSLGYIRAPRDDSINSSSPFAKQPSKIEYNEQTIKHKNNLD